MASMKHNSKRVYSNELGRMLIFKDPIFANPIFANNIIDKPISTHGGKPISKHDDKLQFEKFITDEKYRIKFTEFLYKTTNEAPIILRDIFKYKNIPDKFRDQ
jgi:hypothetical protein